MAGSWRHMTTGSGLLRSNESFCDMIENLGDAYEAAEECYGMIWWLARQLEQLENFPMTAPAVHTRHQVLEIIKRAQENYKSGLKDGGVQKPR
jgi:hypothetical protein